MTIMRWALLAAWKRGRDKLSVGGAILKTSHEWRPLTTGVGRPATGPRHGASRKDWAVGACRQQRGKPRLGNPLAGRTFDDVNTKPLSFHQRASTARLWGVPYSRPAGFPRY